MQLPQSVQQFNHMTPLKTECNAETYSFGKLDRRQVVADFSGGQITNDGDLILIAQIDQQYQISERLAACFEDQRDPARDTAFPGEFGCSTAVWFGARLRSSQRP